MFIKLGGLSWEVIDWFFKEWVTDFLKLASDPLGSMGNDDIRIYPTAFYIVQNSEHHNSGIWQPLWFWVDKRLSLCAFILHDWFLPSLHRRIERSDSPPPIAKGKKWNPPNQPTKVGMMSMWISLRLFFLAENPNSISWHIISSKGGSEEIFFSLNFFVNGGNKSQNNWPKQTIQCPSKSPKFLNPGPYLKEQQLLPQ